MGMTEGVPVARLNHRPPRPDLPKKRHRAAPPTAVVRDLEQICLENSRSLEERSLSFSLEIAGKQETDLWMIDAED